MENKTELRLITTIENLESNNVEIDIDNGSLFLRINKSQLFTTLKERKTIIGLINKKLDDLVEKHIETLALKETELNKDL